MRFLPTRIHAVLDYLLGGALSVFAFVTGFHQGGVIEWGPMLLGHSLILYSLLTNYELGMLRLISIRLHLLLDVAGGVVLIGMASLYGQSTAVWLSLVMLGAIEIGSSLVTRTVTSDGPGLDSPAVMTSTRRSKVAMPLAAGPKTADGRPDHPLHPDAAQTIEQLQGAIDSGKTHDKVAVVDPAAAPLGSDDEAADLHDEEGLATARQAPPR